MDRTDLRADCERCVGLCCVAPAFSASADFAIDKPAGHACPNLQSDFRCEIHPRLRREGFPGCVAYDCFGAGQHVTQVTFAGRDWRSSPERAAQMFEVYTVILQLHELLWYLTEALTLDPARSLNGELRVSLLETERLTLLDADTLVELDLTEHQQGADALLLRTSELARAGLQGVDHRGANLMGADLRGADLRGADLRGAYLIGADLQEADLKVADLIGADLRSTDLSGADLTSSLFLTRHQVDSANGDVDTKLPPPLTPPAHWGPASLS